MESCSCKDQRQRDVGVVAAKLHKEKGSMGDELLV